MYYVTLNLKPTYPVHIQEDPTEVDCTEVTGTLYQNHFFYYEILENLTELDDQIFLGILHL